MKHSHTLSSVQQMAFLLLMRSDCICVSSFMSSYETGFNLTASLLSLSHVFDVFPSSLFCFPNLRIVFFIQFTSALYLLRSSDEFPVDVDVSSSAPFGAFSAELIKGDEVTRNLSQPRH